SSPRSAPAGGFASPRGGRPRRAATSHARSATACAPRRADALPRRKRRATREAGDERPVSRGLWSGTLSFGLVTIPVELYAATRSGAPGLRMLAPDGAPLARRYVCPEEGRELSDDEIERGYEVERGEFVVVTEEELERIAPRRSRDIELVRFVDRDAV